MKNCRLRWQPGRCRASSPWQRAPTVCSTRAAPATMWDIASMTKRVTTTAALQLIERGTLSLDAPVREYRPEFADLPVLTGFDGDTPQLRAPTVQATGRRLVT